MRAQIRARVDTKEWEALRQGDECNTELLARILGEWQEQKTVLSSLSEIDPSPSQALGRLLMSYELMQKASVSIQSFASPEPLSPPAVEANPAPTIGGLENNSGDW